MGKRQPCTIKEMVTTVETLLKEAAGLLPDMITWRRRLHENPELSFEEHKTSAWIRGQFKPIPGFDVQKVSGTSICASLKVNEAFPTVALRCELDALPIVEETGLSFQSKTPGVAHLCGHDAHMAMLLGAATLIARDPARLTHNVKCFFQSAEEKSPGGAKDCVEHHLFNDVSSAFALHNNPRIPVGSIGICRGPIMAETSDFVVTIRGKGGHAALPHLTIDPVVIAAQSIESIQSITSRSVSPFDPAVISVCRLRAGDALNVIPDTAEFGGTIRSIDQKLHESLQERLNTVVWGVCKAHGATPEIAFHAGYPAVVNHDQGVEAVKNVFKAVGADGKVVKFTPLTAGDDFAYFLQKRPGCYFMLGSSTLPEPDDNPIWHSPRFLFNEYAMPVGAALLAGLAMRSAP